MMKVTGYSSSDPKMLDVSKNNLPVDYNVIIKLIENSGGVHYRFVFNQPTAEEPEIIAGTGLTELLGIYPGEFSENKYREIIEEFVPLESDIPSDITEAREKLMLGKIKNFRAGLHVNTAEKGKKWIYETAFPEIDPVTGKVKGITGILYDLEKWQDVVQKTFQKGKYMEERDYLKIAFLRNISHEIRTPLNAIIGFSTILDDPACDYETRKEYTGIILRSADNLLEALDQIVEASLIEAGEIKIKNEKTNINQIIREVYNQLYPKASEKGLKFSYKTPLDDDDVTILTDRYKILKVLISLVGNAIKFTDTGEVEVGYVLSGGMVEFYVYDTGNGIPENCRDHIFDNFFQADSSPSRMYGGTGLGLSISKAYVEMLNGKIWFFSEPGAGTTFYFTIPYVKA